MTWHQTAERLRIIREVEAAAAADLSGVLPWRDSWAGSFGDRQGLVSALRARWDLLGPAPLDELTSPEQVRDAERRLRRTYVGVLRILEAQGLVGVPGARATGPPRAAA